MFRFEMSRAGSVTERVKQRERWRGKKTKPGALVHESGRKTFSHLKTIRGHTTRNTSATEKKNEKSQNGVRQKTRAT